MKLSSLPMSRKLERFGRSLLNTDFILNNVLLLALLGFGLYFSLRSEHFLSWGNIEIILTNDAAIGVVVAAAAILLIAGHVDLSIGSNIAFSGTLTALAVIDWGMTDWLAIVLGISAGAAAGMVNGFLCGVFGLNPIIVTLGMLGLLRGTILLIRPTDMYGLGEVFNFIGNGEVFGIPILLICALLAFVLAAIFVNFTVWGRYIYALGINPQAAFLAALPIRALPFALYVVVGAAAGLAGVLLVARLDGSSPGSLGLQMELQTLTTVLLGGVAFAGGRGRILGVFTAWIFLGVLKNGLTLLNVTPFVQLIVAGSALVFAAALDGIGSALGPRLSRARRVARQVEAAEVHYMVDERISNDT